MMTFRGGGAGGRGSSGLAALLVLVAASQTAAAGAPACLVAWQVAGGVGAPGGTTVRCRDGDPACDADGMADGRCTFEVAFCVNVYDFRTLNAKRTGPVCPRRRIKSVQLLEPKSSPGDPVAADNHRSLAAALGALPAFPTKLEDACTASAPVVVPLKASGGAGQARFRARIRSSRGTVVSRVTLTCDPA